MSCDLSITEADLNESFNGIVSELISRLSSHWEGRQISTEDVVILNDAVQDKIARFLFSQDPDSPGFEKIASKLAAIMKNPSPFSFVTRDVGHLFVTPDGLCFQPRDELIMQAGLRKFWKKHKKEIIIGAIVVAVVTTVVVVTVVTYGTGTKAAAALGSAAASGAKTYLEDDKREKFSNRIQNQNSAPRPSPVPESKPVDFPSIADTLPPHNSPLFLEEGVMLNGRHYAYWEFLQKAKQEEFFTNFLNDPRPTSLPDPGSPLFPIPSNSSPYEPIPPQPGSSILHRFFETLGREILGPEVTAETSPSRLQKSHLFTTSGKRSSSCQVGGVNGINTSLDYAIGHANYVSEFGHGHSVDWVYNNSHGTLGDIFLEVPLNYLGISPNTADLLKDNWVDFHEKNKHTPNARYLQLCHSQGAIHVRNALANAPKEIRDRIIVVAIAPATVVPKELCFNAFNYASKKDIVPFGELLFAGALDTNEIGTSPAVEMVLENRKELILLDPHPDSAGIDHDFRSPTFEKTIRDHIDDYYRANGEYD